MGADEISAAAESKKPGRGSPELFTELREGRAPPTLVAALIAWAITVAPVGFARGASVLAGACASLSLAAGLLGPFLLARRPKLGRTLGISAFVGLSVGAWLAGSGAIHPMRLEPIRGVFGAVAWGVFALSWSDRWSKKTISPPVDPDAPLLLPRSSLPALASFLAGLGVAASLAYLVLAFRVREPDRALVAQALALACSIGIVSAGATVAVARGKARSTAGRRLTPTAIRALLFLLAFGIAGALVIAFR